MAESLWATNSFAKGPNLPGDLFPYLGSWVHVVLGMTWVQSREVSPFFGVDSG